MSASLSLSGPGVAPSRALRHWLGGAVLALAVLGGGYALLAQVAGERGIAPTAASADIEVRGIAVDVTADSAEEARALAWREAQQKAWAKVNGPALSDDQIAAMVSAIVIERERIGPKRYIARLGVVFDRQRAASYLGQGQQARASAPMLLIPVTASAGAYTTFEMRNPWQRAWAEFNPGTSRIDYVRPSGAGEDSLLLNFGQTGRRSRVWWRSTLDQYGAADVLVPIAQLEYQFPGGPISGTFIARYGPDSTVLDSFQLSATGPEDLPEMLSRAVERMDTIFEAALDAGRLRPDPTLQIGGTGQIDPGIQRLIEIGRAVRAQRQAQAQAGSIVPRADAPPVVASEPLPATLRTIVVQFATPDAAAFDATLSAVRGTPGVRSVGVTSTAMGGTSVMNVGFGGSLEELSAALQARGFTVREGANALAISR